MTDNAFASDARDCCASAIDRLSAVLQQTRRFITGLRSDQAYTAKRDGWQGGTIGGHVRHCWDHAAALVEGLTTGIIDYDCRERGTAVETQREAAVFQVDGILVRLDGLRGLRSAHAVTVRAMLAPDEAARELPSTAAREIAFVLSHTIHHQAIMAISASSLGEPIPEGFGYAPSTTAYLRKVAKGDDQAGGSCAR